MASYPQIGVKIKSTWNQKVLETNTELFLLRSQELDVPDATRSNVVL